MTLSAELAPLKDAISQAQHAIPSAKAVSDLQAQLSKAAKVLLKHGAPDDAAHVSTLAASLDSLDFGVDEDHQVDAAHHDYYTLTSGVADSFFALAHRVTAPDLDAKVAAQLAAAEADAS